MLGTHAPNLSVDYESLIRKVRGSARGAEKVIRHLCIVCEQDAADIRANRCANCGGAIDAIYDLDQVDVPGRRDTPNTIKHFFSLLPLRDRNASGWLGEGNTPCFEVPGLARQLGVGRLYFKDESVNPTRLTKDRIASIGLSRFAELGVSKLVIASTGNSSTAYARGAQLLPGFTVHIFIGRDFLNRLNYPDSPAVVTHVVDGEFVAAGELGQRFARGKRLFLGRRLLQPGPAGRAEDGIPGGVRRDAGTARLRVSGGKQRNGLAGRVQGR